MASQQPAPRQWFRLPFVARPARQAAQTPEPRAPVPGTTVRPMGQFQPRSYQPSEPTPAPTGAAGVTSVPTSPIRRTSVPSSPAQAPGTSPTSPTFPAITTTFSVPSPPKPQVSAPSASLPSSPSPKRVPSPPKPSTFSMTKQMPTSPLIPVASSPIKPVPISPAKTVPTSPPKSAATSPPQTVPTMVAPTRLPSPTPTPRTLKPAVQIPPQSPKTKPTAPPPSPLILPPPQLKSKSELEPKIPAETVQNTLLVQAISEKPKTWLNGTGHHDHIVESHKLNMGHHGKHEVSKVIFAKKEKGDSKKFSSDSYEVGMRVLTVAGDNKGALMEVIQSPFKHGFDGKSHTLQQKGNSKTETGWHSSSSGSEQGNSKKKGNGHKEKATHSPPTDAYVNSNVQGINNSIVFNSSYSHHDPGVHLSLSRKPPGHEIHVEDKTSGQHHN